MRDKNFQNIFIFCPAKSRFRRLYIRGTFCRTSGQVVPKFSIAIIPQNHHPGKELFDCKHFVNFRKRGVQFCPFFVLIYEGTFFNSREQKLKKIEAGI